MDEKLIRETKDEINTLILESLTVSDEVLKASEMVEKHILDNIPSRQEEIFANGGGKREMSFQMNVFDEGLTVSFHVTNYNFLNKTYYNSYRKKHTTDVSCGSVFRKVGNRVLCICYINYISLGFIPLGKFYEDLHHELNHILQQYKDGQTYPDSERYTRISSDIYSDDEVRKDVANLLYFANPNEQDSFIGTIYSFVRHNYYLRQGGKSIDDYVKETDAFKNICVLKELFRKIISDKEKYNDFVLKYNGFKRWDRFEKYVRNAIHRFERKMAMCVKKCKQDFLIYEQNTWFEPRFLLELYKIH